MTLLWKVVGLYLSGDRFHRGRLRLYARNGTREAMILRKLLEGLAQCPGLKPNVGEAIAEGAIQTDSTWPRVVANYLLDEKTEAELRSFGADEQDSDPK